MKRFLFATLLCAIGHCAYGADTDGDGLLDLIDVAGFNANASGDVEFELRSQHDTVSSPGMKVFRHTAKLRRQVQIERSVARCMSGQPPFRLFN
jgi:hypothetical protein